MHAIDTHSHFWPSAFLSAARRGKPFFGMTADRGDDGAYVLRGGPYPVKAVLPDADLGNPDDRIGMRMTSQGIAMEAVMISGFLWNYHLPESESVGFSRLINDELSELERSSTAHVGLAHLPLPHTGAAVAEVERCVNDLGLTHFAFGTNFEGLNFDHVDVVPVIDAIAEAGATLSTHPIYFGKIGTTERLHSPLLSGGLASPIEAGVAMVTLITSGVLDRHPDFRAWVSHGGGAAMYAMGRLDRRWLAMAKEARPAAATPSDYLRRFWYGNLLHNDTQLKFLLGMVGADRITIGTDYPFQWDHLGGSANWIRSHDLLDPDERASILWHNAAEFLGTTTSESMGPNG